MPITTGTTIVEGPSTTPARTILDVVQVEPANGHEIMGVKYETPASWFAKAVQLDTNSCISSIAKVPDGFEFEQGLPFHVYSAVQCFTFSGTDYAAEAQNRLTNGEGHAVEQSFWNTLLPARAVDITPGGTAVSPRFALGLLEQYAGANYPFVPTVHAGKRLTNVLWSQQMLQHDGMQPRTQEGDLLIDGGGYTSLVGPGAVALTGNAVWMYITGSIKLLSGEVGNHMANDVAKNKTFALAERSYVPMIDGFAAAIKVTLE